MDLTPLNVSELLRRHGLRPEKSLGQNFLVDEHALERVAEAAGVEAGEAVLEIGPGLGSLTRHLAQRAERVVAVELDAKLIPVLKETLAPFPNVEVVEGDILGQDPYKLMLDRRTGQPQPYRVAANIPYYITSALIRHLLEGRAVPRRVALTVQREVAQRICAQPGDLSLLALSVQVYGQPQIVGKIPAGSFFPPPKVDSAIIRIDLYEQPRIAPEVLNQFFRLAKAGFSQKRKTLRNSLSGGLQLSPAQAQALLEAAGIDPQRRAETLAIEEWQKLVLTPLPGLPGLEPNPPDPEAG
jgi:16S rRNA (adenine1518-N6/adenine1519-N6)-dimethyltransferase